MFKILGADGKEYGPISAETLRHWIAEGRANAQTQVLPAGATAWTPLGQLPEFAAAFSGPPSGMAGPIVVGRTQNILALVGFILSLISITVGLCCCYGFPFNIAGITCSVIGLIQIRRAPERYGGRGFAIAGIVIGLLSIVLFALLMILGVALNWQEIQKEFNRA